MGSRGEAGRGGAPAAPRADGPPREAPACGPPAAPDSDLRRNFVLLTLDGTFFTAGSAFYDSSTVLTAFTSTLTRSKVLIGLAASMRTVGWFLPQLVVANLTEHLRYKGRLVVVNCLLHRAALVVMAAVAYFYAATRPALALALFFPVFVLSALSEGVNGVPWTDVVANSIPPERRGRLFANQQVFGGLWAFGNGFLVRLVLNEVPYPNSYAVLFLCTCGFFLLSVLSFMGVKERPALEVRQRVSLGAYLRSLPGAWRGNPRFAGAMKVRFCLAFIYLSMPFFVLHARQNIGASLGTVGLYVSAQMLGSLAGSALGGRLSDQTGNRAVVVLAVLASFLAPAAALLLTLVHAVWSPALGAALFPLVYLFMGAAFGAAYIGFTNYVIDVAPPAERPTFIGLSNTLMAPFALLSPAGGLLASWLGYEVVFALSAAIALGGVALALRLPEPRPASNQGRRGPARASLLIQQDKKHDSPNLPKM